MPDPPPRHRRTDGGESDTGKAAAVMPRAISSAGALTRGRSRKRATEDGSTLHVPIMPVEVEPSAECVQEALMREPTIVSPAMPSYPSSLKDADTDPEPSTEVPSSQLSNSSRAERNRLARIERNRVMLMEAGFDFEDLNTPGEDKFPVFFAGGSVTVRAWATGAETEHIIKYLCLKAFGSLDAMTEDQLITPTDTMNPQFLEWPSADAFHSRVGAKALLDERPLYAGCILEIRNTIWLESIRQARKRAIVEAQLAPLTRLQRFKHSVHILFNEPSSSTAAAIIAYFVLFLILLSTVTLILETLPQLYNPDISFSIWFYIECFCIGVFTLELAIRFLVCPDKWAFMANGMNIIDLVAIFPFYVEFPLMIAASNFEIPGLAVLRVTRLARVLRLFKVSQGPMQILSMTLKESAQPMQTLGVITLIAAIMFAACMFYAERGEFNVLTGNYERNVGHHCEVPCTPDVMQKAITTAGLYTDCLDGKPVAKVEIEEIRPMIPWSPRPGDPEIVCHAIKERSPYDSIPVACWWSIVTMTTLGYGDITPITSAGKFVAMITMLSGTLVIALPVTVIGQNFSMVYEQSLAAQKRQEEIDKRKRELAKEVQTVASQLDEYRAKAFRIVSKGAKTVMKRNSSVSNTFASASGFFSKMISGGRANSDVSYSSSASSLGSSDQRTGSMNPRTPPTLDAAPSSADLSQTTNAAN